MEPPLPRLTGAAPDAPDAPDALGAPDAADDEAARRARRARPPVAVDTVVAQLAALGVAPGGVCVVHASFSHVGPVEGGPAGLIAALRTVLGPGGTLVMPSMSDDDDVPFDPRTTPCRTMGVVADTFWRLPGVRRSDSPHAFAAVGPHADALLAPHPVEVPHGPVSPPGRARDLDAQILLLGVGHDANTTVHVAESIAGVPYAVPHHATVWRDGRAVRVDYRETDHCCERFALLDGWLGERQRRGVVGHGEARLARARDVVDAAVARLRRDVLVFLHAPGACAECDAARASVPAADAR